MEHRDPLEGAVARALETWYTGTNVPKGTFHAVFLPGYMAADMERVNGPNEVAARIIANLRQTSTVLEHRPLLSSPPGAKGHVVFGEW